MDDYTDNWSAEGSFVTTITVPASNTMWCTPDQSVSSISCTTLQAHRQQNPISGRIERTVDGIGGYHALYLEYDLSLVSLTSVNDAPQAHGKLQYAWCNTCQWNTLDTFTGDNIKYRPRTSPQIPKTDPSVFGLNHFRIRFINEGTTYLNWQEYTVDNVYLYGVKSDTPSPSLRPSNAPTTTHSPSVSPSNVPTLNPSNHPSLFPTISPSEYPSNTPSYIPTGPPSQIISTTDPTLSPSNNPINLATDQPSSVPSEVPLYSSSNTPSSSDFSQTIIPSISPSTLSSQNPTTNPRISDDSNPDPQTTTDLPSNAPTMKTHSGIPYTYTI